jgi:hypothetical protein
MSSHPQSRWSLALATICLAASFAVVAEDAPVPAPSEATAAPIRDAEALALIQGMAKFLAATPRFSVTIRSGYDAVQSSGQKIEFGELRRIVVDRPGRVRIDSEPSDGNRRQILFDGKNITVASPLQSVYAQHAQPGGIDETLRFFKQELHLSMPLAPLLMNTLADELERRIVEITSVETTPGSGTATHHLAARGDTVDLQVWIADGGQPLPQRVVLTYRDAEGQPQYWADFSDWNLSPAVDDATFAFTPPAGASKIAFINQVKRVAPATPAGEQP